MKPVVVGGVSVHVTIASADDEPELENRYALWDGDECTILVNEDCSQEIRWHAFAHELCHAGNWHLSVEHNLKRLGLTEDQASAVEEYMAECFNTHIDTLERNGWIKRPLIR